MKHLLTYFMEAELVFCMRILFLAYRWIVYETLIPVCFFNKNLGIALVFKLVLTFTLWFSHGLVSKQWKGACTSQQSFNSLPVWLFITPECLDFAAKCTSSLTCLWAGSPSEVDAAPATRAYTAWARVFNYEPSLWPNMLPVTWHLRSDWVQLLLMLQWEGF